MLCSSKSVISSWVKAISSILRYTTSLGLLNPPERLPGEDSEWFGEDQGLHEDRRARLWTVLRSQAGLPSVRGSPAIRLNDLHVRLILLFRRVTAGSSLGVWGVPRVVGALVESPSAKASMSGDWGELSMWQAVSAFWYCCRVIWRDEAEKDRSSGDAGQSPP